VSQVPVTHIGRAACVVVMLFMPIIIAFITASTTKSLNLTPDEAVLMLGIDSNHLRVRFLSCAACLVQHWWRFRRLSRARGFQGSHTHVGRDTDHSLRMLELVRQLYTAGP
jgi:hypothetical protein